jgi:hypothetical protein
VTLPEVVTLNIHQAYSLGSCHMLGRGASGFGSPPHHPGTACRDRQQTKIRKTRNMAKPTTALKKCPGPNLAQHPSCHALCPKVTLWKSFNLSALAAPCCWCTSACSFCLLLDSTGLKLQPQQHLSVPAAMALPSTPLSLILPSSAAHV